MPETHDGNIEPGNLPIFVPQDGSAAERIIDPGSGITGRWMSSGQWMLYFEGNRLGAENMRNLADRVLQAADRMLTKYPTTASLVVGPKEVQEVGRFNYDSGLIQVQDADALAQWLETAGIAPSELETTDLARSNERALSRMKTSRDPTEREKAAFLEKHVVGRTVRRHRR